MKTKNHHILPLALALAALALNLSMVQPAQAAGWANTGSLNTPRVIPTATLLPTGKVLVAGGFEDMGEGGVSIASAELYDPTSGSWTAASSLNNARSGHTATLLQSGKVLVAGGMWSSTGGPFGATVTNVPVAELYDPSSGAWTPTGSLNGGHSGHTASLLANGKVLVAGGPATNSPSAELYDPVSGSWTATTGPMNTVRGSHTATLLPNGKVLIAGGSAGSGPLATAELYDPASGSWTPTGPLNNARSSHTATLLPNGKVLVAGGYHGSFTFLTSAELYDPASGTWTPTGSLAAARAYHSATLLPNGKVLVAAGGLSVGTELASAELYDPASGTWASAASLNLSREDHTATLLTIGKVLVVAGRHADFNTTTAELYDYANGAWTATGSLNTARGSHTTTLMPNGKVLVAGGSSNTAYFASAEVYDPVGGHWTATTGPLNSARSGHTATLLSTGKVLVAGGSGGSSVLSSAELYDQAADTWTTTGSMGIGRSDHTATLLANGKVLVAGGTWYASYLDSAQLYDPASGTWQYASGYMNTRRNGHTATLLPNGKVLVAGGYYYDGSSHYLASAELYNPASGTWTVTGSLNTARDMHTATLLANGKVLVAGGYNSSSGGLASAELYDPATGFWTATGSLNTARNSHMATLLANGKVLVAGGYSVGIAASAEVYDPAGGAWTATGPLNTARELTTTRLLANGKVLVAGGMTGGITYTSSAELYDVGLGFSSSWQPQIATVASPLCDGRSLALTGSQFRGVAEGSGGSSQDSPADYPVVQLRRLDNEQTLFLPCANWSATSFTSARESGFPGGYALATMFVNGIPSTSKIVHVGAIALHSPTKLGGGAFRFNFASTPGLTFTVLSSANVALPSSSWTALGSATEISPGQFQFTDSQAPSNPRRYYRVQAGSSGANSVRVALYVVETDASYALDIKSNIVATGLFSDADVDILPTTSDPTLSQLRQYAAVLTSLQGSSFSDSTTYGNTLADYVDQGGGVVINLYCFFSSSTAAGYGFGGLDGRIVSYLPLAQGDVTGETAHLGMVEDLPSHPLLQGVTTFDGGPYCNRFAIGLNPGGTEVAHWTDGLPLIAVSQPGNGRVVGLNFRAMSTAVSSHGYEAGTDGGRILANALMWAGGASSGP